MTPGITSVKFHCPKCEGSYFGSSQTHDGEHMMRHCNTSGCRFSWPSEHDWKHFIVVTTSRFESQQEYLDDYERRHTPVIGQATT